ncbi:DUF1127 domain-containing protein [Bradyrhizobium japonicum]
MRCRRSRRPRQRHLLRRADNRPEKKNDHDLANCRAELTPILVGGFFSTLANLAHALFDRLERRSAVKTLNELDDHALRDIGITRSQIEDAVYGQFKAELTRYL